MKPLLAFVLLLGPGVRMVLAGAEPAAPGRGESQAQDEVVSAPAAPPPSTQIAPAGEGFMEPQQVRDLLQRVYLTEFRINDLFSEVRPEKWNMPESSRGSFAESFAALRSQMEALEAWRSQLHDRPDSMYLAYMMHASVDAILPRLDGVTRIIGQRENSSLGAQFSQAQNQLFDLQQALQPYLVYLLRNQDHMFYAAQTNLASCETRLGAALAGQREPAKVMKNIVPDFKGRRVRKPAVSSGATPSTAPPPAKSPVPSPKK